MVVIDNYCLCKIFELLIKTILKYFLMTFVIETGILKDEIIYFELIFQIMQPFIYMVCHKNVLNV
jgi:hypothetical protein